VRSVHALGQLLASNTLVVTLYCGRLFALSLGRGLLIEFARTQFSDDSCFFDRALKPPKGDIKRLVFLDPDV